MPYFPFTQCPLCQSILWRAGWKRGCGKGDEKRGKERKGGGWERNESEKEGTNKALENILQRAGGLH